MKNYYYFFLMWGLGGLKATNNFSISLVGNPEVVPKIWKSTFQPLASMDKQGPINEPLETTPNQGTATLSTQVNGCDSHPSCRKTRYGILTEAQTWTGEGQFKRGRCQDMESFEYQFKNKHTPNFTCHHCPKQFMFHCPRNLWNSPFS